MSRMLGVFGRAFSSMDRPGMMETIRLLGPSQMRTVSLEEGFAGVAFLNSAPLRGERLFEENEDVILFCGDVVGNESVPWEPILRAARAKDFEALRDFRGRFGLARFDKRAKTITLFSDRRGQQPLYYWAGNRAFVFSTDLGSFGRLPGGLEFDEEWLYEYFYFNYPLGPTTPLKGVSRVPAASVLEYSLHESSVSLRKYAEVFRPSPDPLGPPRSLELAARLFGEVVPGHFSGSPEIACSLTSGWDGRTLLALAPDINRVTAYTYGVAGCQDLREAARAARRIGIRHLRILFDDEFVKGLPESMVDTVYLSGGTEKILRSTLLWVYRQLTDSGRRYPLTVSGMGMDGLLRGHAQAPAIVSADMAEVFRGGDGFSRPQFWRDVFDGAYPGFEENIRLRLAGLREAFGDFRSPSHHLLFKLYATHPQLFGGELKIAENYTTVRVPSWDPGIIGLAFSIKESSLSFSEFTGHRRGDLSEVILQAYILSKSFPMLAKLPVGNVRPDFVLRGPRCIKGYRVYRKVVNGMKALTRRYAPLEDWENWLNVAHREFIEDLVFSERSLLRDHIGRTFIESIRRSRDLHWLGKLATAEIVMRLVKEKWTRQTRAGAGNS